MRDFFPREIQDQEIRKDNVANKNSYFKNHCIFVVPVVREKVVAMVC
jgi:hypothetical protein